MKTRSGFVSNSSSSSFIITNLSNKEKSLLDFAKENLYLLKDFNDSYGYDYNEKDFLISVKEDPTKKWKPNESKECGFGDESGTIVGIVYDYILRDGGTSENFSWKFHSCRGELI